MPVSDPAEWTEYARPSFKKAQDVVFVSAQTGDPSAAAKTQLAQLLEKIATILDEAQCAPADVVKLGIFYAQSLADEEDDLLLQARSFFPEHYAPVVTMIPLHVIPGGHLLQGEVIAIAPGTARATRKTVDGPAIKGQPGFSASVRCGDLVFVGAQMSVDGDGATVHQGDIVAQAKQTIANLDAALNEAGTDLRAGAKLNTYYVGTGTTEDWKQAAQVRSDAFEKPGPGATGLPIPGHFPDDILVRQEIIAIAEEDGSPSPRVTSWPEGVWDWPIPVSFEQGLLINGLIVTGGQIAADTSGIAVYPDDLAAQTRDVMETIVKIIGGYGVDNTALSKLTIFYATKGDPSDLDVIMKEVEPFFPKEWPALTIVPLGRIGLTGIDIEIEAVGQV